MIKLIKKISDPKTKFLVQVFQFFPLAVFMAVARNGSFQSSVWPVAFQWGALSAIVETIVIFAVLKVRLSHLIAAVNVFLIFGGIGFYFNNRTLLSALDHLRATGLIISVALVTLISMIASKGTLNKYSYIFMGAVILAAGFSYMNRAEVFLSGVLPFVFLIISKRILEKKQTLKSS